MQQRFEAATGLQVGELRVLQAVDAGAASHGAIARRTGDHRDGVKVILESFERRGLIKLQPTDDERDRKVVLTELARTRLDQLEGLQMRLLALLPTSVAGPLFELAEALEGVQPQSPPGLAALPSGPHR